MIYELKQLYHRLRLTWQYFRTFGIPEVEPSHPAALARAKEQGTHYFVVKVTWDADEQTWMVESDALRGGMTNHDDLPGALAMFGDAAMLLLEHDMKHDLYPAKMPADGVRVVHHDTSDLLGSVGAGTSLLMRWDGRRGN